MPLTDQSKMEHPPTERNSEATRHDLRSQLPAAVAGFLRENADSIFTDPDWLSLLASSAWDPTSGPELLCVNDANGIEAALPIAHSRISAGGVPIPVTLSLTNFYALEYGPIVAGGANRADALRRLVRELRSRASPLIRLAPMCDSQASELELAFADCGMATIRYAAFGNWIEHVRVSSFEEYFSGRPGQLRNTYRRRAAKLHAAHKVDIRVATDRCDDIECLRGAWHAVYAQSWKTSEPYPEFIPRLIDIAARRGWLRLGVLYADERPIASQLWLHRQGVSMIYKLAYDERYRHYSPGLVLSVEMFRNAIDGDRARVIDYGSGDDPYKRDWMTERRQRWALDVFDTGTIRGRILFAAKRMRQSWVER